MNLDFHIKKQNFLKLFASQNIPVTNLSCLTPLKTRGNKLTENVTINEGDITYIVKKLIPNKSHGWDNLAIRMIKIFGQSISYLLTLISIDSLQEGIFPESWKKANIVPVNKKENKILIRNYRPISLLPIFGIIIEQFIFNNLFNHFIKNDLFTKCQSGFLPGDSYISQLVSVAHEINLSFDGAPSVDVREVFLHISKVF